MSTTHRSRLHGDCVPTHPGGSVSLYAPAEHSQGMGRLLNFPLIIDAMGDRDTVLFFDMFLLLLYSSGKVWQGLYIRWYLGRLYMHDFQGPISRGEGAMFVR